MEDYYINNNNNLEVSKLLLFLLLFEFRRLKKVLQFVIVSSFFNNVKNYLYRKTEYVMYH